MVEVAVVRTKLCPHTPHTNHPTQRTWLSVIFWRPLNGLPVWAFVTGTALTILNQPQCSFLASSAVCWSALLRTRRYALHHEAGVNGQRKGGV